MRYEACKSQSLSKPLLKKSQFLAKSIWHTAFTGFVLALELSQYNKGIFACLVHLLLKHHCHEVRIILVQCSSATFICDFGQVMFDQFYIACGTYGHFTMAYGFLWTLMDSV